MTITVLLDPNEMPNRSQDQETFDNNNANLYQKLPILGAQINATAANLNSIAVGGAYALAYTYANKGVIGDGAGKRMSFDGLSGFTPSSATLLYLENTDLKGPAAAAVSSFAASTSAVKGQILVVAQGDVSKWVRFNVNGVNSFTNFKSVDVTPIDSSASSPFTYGDTLLVQFQRTGDKGDAGALTPAMLVQHQVANAGNGGATAGGGFQTRPLNTVVKNTITGASLASNQVTLPAGTYRIQAYSSVYNAGKHKVNLYDAAGPTLLVYGSSESSVGVSNLQSRSTIGPVELTFATSKTIYLQHYTGTGDANGLGIFTGNGIEIYAEIFIEKVS